MHQTKQQPCAQHTETSGGQPGHTSDRDSLKLPDEGHAIEFLDTFYIGLVLFLCHISIKSKIHTCIKVN